jgi:DNA-binding PadR family transcriptional regulator
MFRQADRSFAGREHHGNHGSGGGGFFGGPFRGFRGGGPGMRTGKMLVSGDLQLIILLLLAEKPRHGYEIIKAIEEHSSGVYTPSPGMVYPALTYLEEMGYATAAVEGTKKLFTISSEGAAHLRENQAAATEVWNQLAMYGRKVAHFQRQFAQDEDVADQFGGGPSAKDDWKQMKSEFRELRDELKAAIYEKISASTFEKRRVLDVLRRAAEEIRRK